jgi:uncharacterized membrane protein
LTNIRRETVLACLQKYHPSTIAELKRRLTEEGIRSTDEDLLDIVGELRSDGEIDLFDPVKLNSFPQFLLDATNSWWVYAVVLVSILELFLVAYPTQNIVLVSFRLLFGLGLLGFLPGYSTVQILFPKSELGILERLLLSMFLSVVISIAIGVALGAGYLFTGVSSVLASTGYVISATLFASHRRYSAIRTSYGLERRKFC